MSKFRMDSEGFGAGDVRIPWSDVLAVGIRTTADGPWAEDFFWMFALREDRVIELGNGLLSPHMDALHAALPGLDDRKLIDACGSTDERIYSLWNAEDAKFRWVPETFRERFAALVMRLGGNAHAAADAFERLVQRWAEPARHYHDTEHLAHCLRELDRAHAEPALADVAELALWFHDAIYDPRARDNETRSAELLVAEGTTLGLPVTTLERAAALVRATAHATETDKTDPAAALVLDVDLAILGSDVLRFMDYEYAIAEEFRHVAGWRFFIGRGRFLASLLARERLFRTEAFRARYEQRARANLDALLRSPHYAAYRWVRPFLPTAHATT